MAKMGRPQVQIDQKMFENLCALQCTADEIGSVFGCTDDTITNWCKRTYGETFSEVYKKHSAKGKISLRRYQFKMAERNPSMAIFLGKQWLGQTDRIEQTITEVEDLSPLAALLKEDVACDATNAVSDTEGE